MRIKSRCSEMRARMRRLEENASLFGCVELTRMRIKTLDE